MMTYKNIETILPKHLIELIQKYVDGEAVYIPRKRERKKGWGELSGTREFLDQRNKEIYGQFVKGCSVNELSVKYFLSAKSVQRIVRDERIKS